jgi:ribonucleotide reductase beta subunit family protein with ferritin-like domain
MAPATQLFDPLIDQTDRAADRFVIGEKQNMEVFAAYKRALACFWVAESIDLSADYAAFEKLSDDERSFILRVIAFFAGSDGIVLENLAGRFYCDVQLPEARLFYGLQIAIENIHSEVYADLLKVYERDAGRRETLLRAIDDDPAVGAKARWAMRWMRSDAPFGERLVAFAAVEGILFSSSFAAIFYFRKRGIALVGLTQSNEYIARDEAMHCQFACLLHRLLQPHNRCAPALIEKIVRSAVDVECQFVRSALAKPILGMNAAMMSTYVQFVADVLLVMLDCPKAYDVENPLQFMETISLASKANFFERRVTEYSLADVAVDKAPRARRPRLDDGDASDDSGTETGHIFCADADF